MSSVYSYRTLSTLRTEYLTNLGHETFRSIHLHSRPRFRSEFQKERKHHHRKPKRNFDPSLWKEVLEESLSYNQENLIFIAIMDRSGKMLASVGESIDEFSKFSEGFAVLNGRNIFVMDSHIPRPKGPPHRGKRFEKRDPDRRQINRPSHKQGSSGRPEFQGFKGEKLRIALRVTSADFILKRARIQLLTSCLAIGALGLLTFYFLGTLRRFINLQEIEKSQRHLTSLGRMGATLAHEIRNPLGAMKGLTQVIQEDLSSDHHSQQSLATIVSEAERLEILVNDLLNYAKPKTVKIEKIDLDTLFKEIDNVLQHKLQEKKVSITFHQKNPNPSLYSDKDSLRQVLLNVIVNAIEATPSGKVIEVNTTIGEQKEFLIEVVDQGEGLGTKNPEELFEPFMTTKLKGTGLGLSISKKIVESLDGTIYLVNNDSVGAKCVIRLPQG